MDPEPEVPGEDVPTFIAEAQTALRDGIERAHELVVEAKLAMRQLTEPEPPLAD